MTGANPDLPILDELREELEALAAAEPVNGNGRHGSVHPRPVRREPHPAPRERQRMPAASPAPRRRRGQAPRVARRATIVLVLLCLIGGVALAARFGASGRDVPAHTAPALLGRAASGEWRLSAYRDRGRLCFYFAAPSGELSSDCGAEPAADGLRATSVVDGGRRFVVGLAGPHVAAITLAAGPARGGSATRRPLDLDAAAASGVPAGARWFVIDLDAGSAGRAPALVTPLDGDGQPLGAPFADCSLGVIGAACERRIRAAAANAGS